MKKYLILLLLLITGCSEENQRIKTPTKLHEIMGIDDKFICNDLIDSTYKFISYNELYSNNSVYEISLNGQLFSNDQHCKLKEDENIDSVMISDYTPIFIVDGKMKRHLPDYEGLTDFENEQARLLLNEGVIKYAFVNSGNKDNVDGSSTNYTYNTYYGLKDDGNIYEYELGLISPSYKFEITETKLSIYTKETYGKITDFQFYDDLGMRLVTETSLYTTEEIETEECTKYVDVKCEEKLIQNENYIKYKDQIKYIDTNYLITVDDYLISTTSFSYLPK